MDQAILILLVVLFGVGVFIVAWAIAETRRQALAKWSASRGLKFHPSRDGTFGDRHPHFACLNKGLKRYAENIMEGHIGKRRLCAFDYHYETPNGHSGNQRHRFSAVILTTNLSLKPLLIRHEGFFDRVAALLGFEKIEFESAEFSREFHVTSPDRRWAFDVLPQATMEFLLNSPKFVLEFKLCQIIAYRDNIFSPADFDSAIQVIEGIIARLPNSLLQELQGVGE